MYDHLALESVSNTNLGQNLKRAKNISAILTLLIRSVCISTFEY